MAGTILVTGASSGEPTGQRVLGPWNIQSYGSVGETLCVALASGDNTFAVPVGAVAAVLVPPAGGTVAVSYRSSLNASDSGLPISTTGLPNVYAFPVPAPATIIVNAASAVAAGFVVAFV